MDNSYVSIQKLADYVATHGLMRIPHCGSSRLGRFVNPPNEHLEICFHVRGEDQKLLVGDMAVTFRLNHVSFHNVHFGNYSEKIEDALGWFVFFDITGITELAELGERPLFECMEVVEPQKLELAFKTLVHRCQMLGKPHAGYLSGDSIYDPKDDGAGVGLHGILIKAAVLELFATLIENAEALGKNRPIEHLSMVRAAASYIAENFSNATLTLSDLAGEFQLSDDYFGMLFKRHIGMTPMQYLATVRVNQSKLLLKQTSLSIGEIAFEVGFNDPLYFSRVFRSTAGMPPRDFRRSCEHGDLTSG